MSYRFLKLACALFVTFLLVGAGGVATAAVLEAVAVAPDGANVDPEAASSDATTFFFAIGPGDSWGTYAALNGTKDGKCGEKDYDTFVMKVTAKSVITIDVIDCCLTGDTICAGSSAYNKQCATSPDTVSITTLVPAGVWKFFVVYELPHTCVFPAGYDILVTAAP